MTDQGTTAPRPKQDEVIEDAVIVDEATGTPVEVETVHVTDAEPVAATTDPGAVRTEQSATTEIPAEPAQRVVYVELPAAPRKLGNRGVGVLIAVLSAVVFTALLVAITAIIGVATTGRLSFGFLAQATFYVPSLFFLIAFVLVVLVANRANWWAHIIGGIVVGLIVYFGTIGFGLLSGNIILSTPEEAADRFRAALGSPFVIISALLAREVSMWAGAIISRRGRRVTARNAEARAAYDREIADRRAAHERGASAAAAAG